MCGVIGVFNNPAANDLVEKGMELLSNRGRDARGKTGEGDCCIGHCLHSIVGFVPQPITRKATLAANCEIYNWKELAKEYRLEARNDADVLLKLLEKEGMKALELLDGVYACAFWEKDPVYLFRDILGIKPMWYSHTEGFAFASEKKALE